MKQPLVKDTLKLCIKFQNNFDNYVKNQAEKETLFNISDNLLALLHEIVLSNDITNLLIANAISRQERRNKRNAKDKTEEEEDNQTKKTLKQEKDVVKYKRAENTSSFNQRSIRTINHFYHSINELIMIREIICDTAFIIAKSSIEEAIEMKYGKISRVSNFILRKQIKEENTSNNYDRQKRNRKLNQVIDDGFKRNQDRPKRYISFNEYIRKGKLGLEMSQYDLLTQTNLMKSSVIKERSNVDRNILRTEIYNKRKINLPAINSFEDNNLNQNKGEQIQKLSPYKTSLNFTLFPMEANMNIKRRLENRVVVIKKNNLSLKQRTMLFKAAFDYQQLFAVPNNHNHNHNHKTSKSLAIKKRTLS